MERVKPRRGRRFVRSFPWHRIKQPSIGRTDERGRRSKTNANDLSTALHAAHCTHSDNGRADGPKETSWAAGRHSSHRIRFVGQTTPIANSVYANFGPTDARHRLITQEEKVRILSMRATQSERTEQMLKEEAGHRSASPQQSR